MSLFKRIKSYQRGARRAQKTVRFVGADKEVEIGLQKRGANRQPVATLTFRSLLILHRQVAADALSRMLRASLSSFLNSLLIAVAFSLPVLLFVLISNVQNLAAVWDGQPRISIYLNRGVAQKTIDQYLADFHKDPLIKDILYISPQQAVNEFRQYAKVQDVVAQLGFNPLPGLIELIPVADATFEQLEDRVATYEKLMDVDQIRMDRQWVKRLQAILAMLQRLTVLLGVGLGLSVVLVIGNTIRLNIEARRDEIKIISMVGGTRGFIAMPFVYMGMWYGLAGAVLAQILVVLLLAFLESEVVNIAGLYNSEMTLSGPDIAVAGVLLLAGVCLGAFAAIGSCYRHFQTLEV